MKSPTKMARGAWLILTVSAALGALVGCKRPANQGFFKTSFQTESQFVVENIVTDIAEMLYFASHHALPKELTVDAQEAPVPDGVLYDIKIKIGRSTALQTKLTISGPIWSDAVYSDLTSALARSFNVVSPNSIPSEDTTMLESLTDGLPETIAQEDVVLSTDLEQNFSNPGLHEEAAAILGAFALREKSGPFYDIRLPLCRMTAHLALARFFAGDNPFDVVGQVAECMLATHMHNQADAVDQIEHLDTAQKPVATWARTLRACNTLDFRPLNAATNVPGIEQIAWFYAYSAANNRTLAWNRVGDAIQRQPDFCRIVAGLGFDVGTANVMDQIWIPLEYGEISQVYKTLEGRDLRKEDFITSLNADPDRCFVPNSGDKPHVRVIGWGLWAMQLQRHLCDAVTTDFHIYQNDLGLPDQAWQFAQECEGQLGQLRFYGFVRRLDCTNDVTYREATDDGWAFATQFPQLTPVLWMDYLCGDISYRPNYNGNSDPHCADWLKHNPLPGTAYNVDVLLDFVFFGNDDHKVSKAHEIAPYDIPICKYLDELRAYGRTSQTAEAIFGKLYPYSATAEAWIAASQTNNPELYVKTMEMAAQWDPSFYENLAQYELNRGLTNEAMAVYEKEDKVDPDVVKMSNVALQRVKYYLARGQKEKAREIADAAGEVYSWGGLAAKADYFEETGDLQQAFDWYSKIDERYNAYSGSAPVLEFCCRHLGPGADPDFDKKVAARLQKWYNQKEKVTLSSFSGAPPDGVVLLDTTPELQSISITKGAIIVGERGIRVHNTEQAMLARDMDRASDLKIIFWDGSGYHEATAILNDNHRLGVQWDTYTAKNK